MNWLKNLTKKKEVHISSNSEFWEWFSDLQQAFYKVIQSNKNVERDFINPFSSAIKQLNPSFYFLAGMLDDNTAELIITADGNFQVIPYVEDLIESAPELANWMFTAHKTPGKSTISINMSGHQFNSDTLSFSINEHEEYPDEIDLSIIYKNYNDKEQNEIANGCFIFLDNYLGEIRSISTIDKVEVIGPKDIKREVVEMEKLEDYLIWREKEFVEKYDGIRYDTEKDEYSSLEAQTNEGLPLVAIINSTLLNWDKKASHPWMLWIYIDYDGKSSNGMPDEKTFQLMNGFDDQLLKLLIDSEGYLNIGRETGNNNRTIFYACKDFRLPVRILDKMKTENDSLNIQYEIFKDKYWMSLNKLTDTVNLK